ncbi:MAG: hypothetical protein SPH43_04665 [Candidatus Enteromonas sp.]|nr:hypothetical protein [Candidatus Enteromonas sp.]
MKKKKMKAGTIVSTVLLSLVFFLFILTCILQLALPPTNGFVA